MFYKQTAKNAPTQEYLSETSPNNARFYAITNIEHYFVLFENRSNPCKIKALLKKDANTLG